MKVPAQFRNRIIKWHGEAGAIWLDQLRDHLSQCASQLRLTIGNPVQNLSVALVVKATRKDGHPVLLKTLPPCREIYDELEALEQFAKHARVVNLVDSDRHLAAIVVDRIFPGFSLRQMQHVDDDAATKIAATLISDVMECVPSTTNLLHTIDEIGHAIQVAEGLNPSAADSDIFSLATPVLNELVEDPVESKLLHGDLHHDNILFDRNLGWITIDPCGRICEPAYNAARLLNNFWDTVPTVDLVRSRLEILESNTNCDAGRILKWAFLDSVLLCSWQLEATGSVSPRGIRILRLLHNVLTY